MGLFKSLFGRLPLAQRRRLKRRFNEATRRMAWLVMLHRRTVSRRATVVAVTGTAGKTTTVRLCRAVAGRSWADARGANVRAAITRELFRQTSLRKPYVLEIGTNRPGESRNVARVFQPTTVILSAATADSEHMKSFRDRAHVLECEADLLRPLPRRGFAILNGDDPEIRALGELTRARVITFGLREANDIRATDVSFDWPRGTSFNLIAGGRCYRVATRLQGPPMLYSTLAALALAHSLGRDLEQEITKLAGVAPTPGRLQPMKLPNEALALRDDYKASVETMNAALDFFETLPAVRRLGVIGGLDSPPNPQRPHYKAVGTRLGATLDRAILITTSWQDYRAGMIRAGMPREHIVRVRTVAEAAEVLRGWLQPGDLVLVKGRNVQHLTRVILAANGETVGCVRRECHLAGSYCESCKYVRSGAP